MSEFSTIPMHKQYMTCEGELVPAKRDWQVIKNTSGFSNGLGVVEVAIGLLVLAGFISVPIGALGALLAFLTPFVTLSFLITTPEVWVPALGGGNHGFPYVSGAGRLVLKGCDVACRRISNPGRFDVTSQVRAT
jgi:uncharacterized membrane protein YkgB